MHNGNISRRAFTFAGAGLAASELALPQGAKAGLTAGQVIERIKANVGVPWRTQTVDNIIVGSPEMPVKGIATTMMATLDVVQRAAAAGRNMVVTHEPTWWMHQDQIQGLTGDATYQYKLDFLRTHDMVVFHFHDHWHAHRPDGIGTGVAADLGWEKNIDPQNPRHFVLPPRPLATLAKEMAARLNIRAMRVVGDPDLTVSHVATSWGYISREPGIAVLSRPEVDVLVVGETREWELVEYAQDIAASGKKKALILLGHVVSEQPGMKYCAQWLKSFITEVPIEFIAAPEPYWPV